MPRFRNPLSGHYARENEIDRNKARNRDNEYRFWRREHERHPVAEFHAPAKQRHTPIADHYSRPSVQNGPARSRNEDTFLYETPALIARVPVASHGRQGHDFEPPQPRGRTRTMPNAYSTPLFLDSQGRHFATGSTSQQSYADQRYHVGANQQYHAFSPYSSAPHSDPSAAFTSPDVQVSSTPDFGRSLPDAMGDHSGIDKQGPSGFRFESNGGPYDPAENNSDPRPAKSSVPSRIMLLSPNRLRHAVSRLKRQKENSDKDDLEDMSDVEHDRGQTRYASNVSETQSTQAVVDGDSTPRIGHDAEGSSDMADVTPSSVDPSLGSSEVPTSMAIDTSVPSGAVNEPQPPEKIELPARHATLGDLAPRTFLDISHDREDGVPEMQGDADGTRPKGDSELARVTNDLFQLCMLLKNFAPDHPDLSRCKSAEKAAHVLKGLYLEAIDGWKLQYERAEQLDRIVGDVEKLRKRAAELEGRNDLLEVKDELFAQTKKANVSLEAQKAKMELDHQTLMDQQRRSYEATISHDRRALNDKIAELGRENMSLKQGHETLRQTANDYQLEAGRQRQEVRRLEEIVKNTIGKSESDKRTYAQERESLTHEHRSALAALEISHMTETKNLRGDVSRFEFEKASLRAEHADEINKLCRQHSESAEEQQEQHSVELRRKDEERREAETHLDEYYKAEMARQDREMQKLREAHISQQSDQTARHQLELKDLHGEIERLRADAHQVQDRARQMYLDQEQKLKANHLAQLREVRQEKEDLVGALVQRDGFKGITDRVLETRFKKLAKTIDQFSRTCTSWDKSKEISWPLSSRSLQAHENTRQIKQYWVQSWIWTTLYNDVFDNPFKPFGMDGDEQFRTWTDTFGEGKWQRTFNR